MAAVNACEKIFQAAVLLVLNEGFTIPSCPALHAYELVKRKLALSSKLENAKPVRYALLKIGGMLHTTPLHKVTKKPNVGTKCGRITLNCKPQKNSSRIGFNFLAH